MAAGYLSPPGTEYGPCDTDCAHTDCAQTRAMAKAPCVRCDKEIGYDTGFYRAEEAVTSKVEKVVTVQDVRHVLPFPLVHATCEEAAT